MLTRSLIHTWCLLIGLSVIGTALSLLGPDYIAPWFAAFGILIVAWAKACLILLNYLGLSEIPQWRRSMVTALTIVTLLFAMLWLVGYLMAF